MDLAFYEVARSPVSQGKAVKMADKLVGKIFPELTTAWPWRSRFMSRFFQTKVENCSVDADRKEPLRSRAVRPDRPCCAESKGGNCAYRTKELTCISNSPPPVRQMLTTWIWNSRLFVWWVTFVIATIGLTVSVASNLASCLGLAILNGTQIIAIHAGMTVALFPVIFFAKRLTGNAGQSGGGNAVLAGCPSWAGFALKAFFGYAVLSSIYFLMPKSGVRMFGDSSVIQVFSSVWMLAYGFAIAILYSVVKAPEFFQVHRAPTPP